MIQMNTEIIDTTAWSRTYLLHSDGGGEEVKGVGRGSDPAPLVDGPNE